jgi:dihydroorotate dehydrogenase electron transfer subunit
MPDTQNPLRAAYYADHASFAHAVVIENVHLAKDTYRVRVACPEIARGIRPGQFVMLRLTGDDDPLIGRALALYDTYVAGDGKVEGLDLVYLVVGKLTRRLACATAGTRLDLWGPLGNGFPPLATAHLILVAGGIGHTPFLAVAKQWLANKQYGGGVGRNARAGRVTLCYGTRSRELVSCVDDYSAAGVDVRISTDDGTEGRPGFVTDDLRELLAATADARETRHIFCCGPEPMMEATAQIAHEFCVPCHVSLETPMACGIGICFSCVAKVRQPDGGWDWKRTCVEGPVFDAEKIEW